MREQDDKKYTISRHFWVSLTGHEKAAIETRDDTAAQSLVVNTNISISEQAYLSLLARVGNQILPFPTIPQTQFYVPKHDSCMHTTRLNVRAGCWADLQSEANFACSRCIKKAYTPQVKVSKFHVILGVLCALNIRGTPQGL